MAGMELIARAMVSLAGDVLLARVVDAPWWFLPGGHVERGERAEEALRRELAEELGVREVEVDDVVAIIENRYADERGDHHELNLVFDVRLPVAEVRSAEPHLELRWFDRSRLGDLDLRPAALHRVLAGEPDGRGLRVHSDGFGGDGFGGDGTLEG
jgi:8-oxo-dGTP diphosphatase